jgi:alpha-beta hydrolase superfamily lysophospholipase
VSAASDYAQHLPAGRRVAARHEPTERRWAWRRHDVRIAEALAPESPARLLVVHGAGAHADALWPIGSLLHDRGLEVLAVDLPLYGGTRTHDPAGVRYDDWVALLVDLVAAERERDPRPLVLLGASIGGMLALEVAGRADGVDAVLATCLLDPRDTRVRMRMTRFGPLAAFAPLLLPAVRGRLARLRIPMSAVADLRRMSRSAALSRQCAADPRGGGARVPLGFLASYLAYRHTGPRAATAPVTLVHPDHDSWTPMELSARVLRRLRAPSRLVPLRGCGHFPVEEPGLGDLLDEVASVMADVGGRR